jgi:hypothetical protein
MNATAAPRTLTPASPFDLTPWSFARYEVRNPDPFGHRSPAAPRVGDLVCTPATAHFAAVLRSTPDSRQVVIWANNLPEHVVCMCEEGKALASLMCMWEGRYAASTGRFGKTVHADGTRCSRSPEFDCYAHPYCPTCGSHDTLTTAMEAYGNRTTCTTEGCTYESYYSIGD